jgi:hypothetical protein
MLLQSLLLLLQLLLVPVTTVAPPLPSPQQPLSLLC